MKNNLIVATLAQQPLEKESLRTHGLRMAHMMVLLLALISGGYAMSLPAKANLAQVLIEKAWQKSQASGSYHKPWSWADVTPVMRIQAKKQNYIALSGFSGQALAFGPGHLSQSGMPGEKRSVVLAAHQDTQFRFLETLSHGDEIVLEDVRKQKFKYVVSHQRIVNSQKEKIQVTDTAQLQLITCYHDPQQLVQNWRGRTPWRRVVYADLVQEEH